MTTDKQILIPHENALDFMLGGNALFTMASSKTGNRFTYKILKDVNKEDCLKVLWMNGKDNTMNYVQIASIEKKNFMPVVNIKSIHYRENKAFLSFDFVFKKLVLMLPMPSLEIYHHGRCSRCGRILTVPDSIMNGIGPECIFKQNAFEL